jgi:hypothetical protein
VFARAREEGYLLTMHCDVNQEDSVAHIWECVDLIGVSRIDHGVNALEDPALCAVLASAAGADGLPDLQRLRHRRAADGRDQADAGPGMRVTVNSDDPAYFGGYIDRELRPGAARRLEAWRRAGGI